MRVPTVLLLILVLGSAVRADEDAKPADEELERQVNAAIDRGAAWLAEQQDWNGSFPGAYAPSYSLGSAALPLLALLHSGVPKDGVAVRRGITWLRAMWRSQPEANRKTYGVSVAVMALVEYGRGPEGAVRLGDEDRAWLEEMVEFLVGGQGRSGAWWYAAAPGRGTPSGHDHSNSQYALLALKEARRAGVPVPEEVFLRALRHFLSVQEREGPKVRRYEERGGDGVYSAMREETKAYDRARGWGYSGPATGVTGSMTAAGVAAVTICAEEIDAKRYESLVKEARQSARDGLAWLGRSFRVDRNPPGGRVWHYYYLYGLERAGVLARVVYMGGHRWYAEGARYLVDAQGPDGAWRPAPGGGSHVDQSFALLFLARSTARALGVATEKPLADLTRGDGLDDADFETLFSAAFEELGGLGGERAEQRAREFALLGPRLIPLLLRRLAAESETVRARAATILRAVTGETFDYDPAAADDEREAAADRWTEWYLSRRGKLTLDREKRLLR
jgi:hypothetical protein